MHVKLWGKGLKTKVEPLVRPLGDPGGGGILSNFQYARGVHITMYFAGSQILSLMCWRGVKDQNVVIYFWDPYAEQQLLSEPL